MSEAEIIVAGHICLDITPGLSAYNANWEDIFRPGRLLEIGPALLTTGGAVGNTGLALHQLGVQVQLVSKVGDDVFGQTIVDILNDYDPRLSHGIAVARGEHTSYTIIITRPGADRMFLHHPGANNTFVADDIDYEAVSRSRIFHFGYPPAMKRMYENEGAELAEILRGVKARGVMTSLDMVMPDPSTPAGQADWRSILKNVLPLVDVFLPSIEEMLLMLEPDLFHELTVDAGEEGLTASLSYDYFSRLAGQLLGMGASIVGLKAGSRGLYLRTADLRNTSSTIDHEAWSYRELWAPCFKVEVVSTTGAGDATVAGFLAGLLHGLRPAKTAIAAVATGACKVEASDVLKGIVPWPLLQERIAAGWDSSSSNLETNGWSFDVGESIWRGPHDSLARTAIGQSVS